MARGLIIYGEVLRRVREERFYTQDEFARMLGLGVRNIQRIEGSKTAGIGTKPFRLLMEMLGNKAAAIRQQLEVNGKSHGKKARSPAGPASIDLDRNVETYSEQPLMAEIPLFDLAVAAGDWTDITEIDEARLTADQIRQALFRVRISGDSMTPKYKSGQVVEFRCIRVADDGFIEGKNYYVQRDDGTATFKHCCEVAEETVTFCALNQKKYPKAFEVPRALIVRAALAVAKVEITE